MTRAASAPAAEPVDRPAGGLRERKKRIMRQKLSDTATRLFMEHGFDLVRVADVAEECGVSEATVFNYFRTKEALVLDRLEATRGIPAGSTGSWLAARVYWPAARAPRSRVPMRWPLTE